MSAPSASRREALRLAALSGGAALSAASLAGLLRAGAALAQDEGEETEGDPGILAGLVDIEQNNVLAYRTATEKKLLGSAVAAGDLFRSQSQEHVVALSGELLRVGGKAPPPPGPEDVAGLSEVKTSARMLEFLVHLENIAISAYVFALMNLQDTTSMKLITEIMGNDAQHLVVLRQAIGDAPVPSAFPSGAEKH